MTQMEKTFSLFVFGDMLPKPTLVKLPIVYLILKQVLDCYKKNGITEVFKVSITESKI